MDFASQIGDDQVEIGERKNNLALDDVLVVEYVVTAFDLESQECASRIGTCGQGATVFVGRLPHQRFVGLGGGAGTDLALALPLLERPFDFAAQPAGVAAGNSVWPLR